MSDTIPKRYFRETRCYILTVATTNILFEILMIGLAILCVFDITRKSKNITQDLLAFIMGIIYGIVLELMTISAFHFYAYGQFLLMFYNVPISIGIGWGVIIYAVKLITSKYQLNKLQKGIFSGLLALNIDLSMDIIAVKLGFWKWGLGDPYEYFFIPFGNFYAWFNVVSSFVFFLLLFETYNNKNINFLSGILSFLCSLIWVVFTNSFYVYLFPNEFWIHFVITWGLIGSAFCYLAYSFFYLKEPLLSSQPLLSKSIFLSFHLFFFIFAVIEGIFLNIIFLLISGTMIIIIEVLFEGKLVKLKLLTLT